ncbi:MAG: bifunctional oligoribonuclease/PAP phosphatase NrnA [Candidatus Mcinerneyibacterium aminivorans]|uniref:Bifunctional oligoribonuclease/PAP phosphatase NrnA n=1 Tax=Candidatus Mcinerneyibacterium aminivorans TaxID=2703815 RepID=A0A5D0MK60_9BACT|nr:MAG: bifunctional oligoribonuclease/PAP phosphatase NrnA [Candidatus Mcinerneyibacterium aminivorans]
MIMNKLAENIKKFKKFEIITHQRADGDAAASEAAFALLLKYFSKKVKIVDLADYPDTYKFLIKNWKNDKFDNPDCTVYLDCGERSRIDEKYMTVLGADYVINIDHHTDNSGFGDYNLVLSDYSSTAEIIFHFFKKLKIDKNDMGKSFFESIYAGISTDTGNLSFSNANSRTFRTVSEIMEILGNPGKIYKQIYCNKQKNKVKLTGEVLKRIKTYFDNRLVISYVSNEDLEKYNIKHKDLEGLVDYLGEIRNTEVYVLIKQLERRVARLSLRSTGNISVLEFAKKNSGGGHDFAAGATLNENLNKAIKIIKNYWRNKL